MRCLFGISQGNYRKSWVTTIAIIFLLAFAFQGSRGLWEPDEGRYVRCAYEMVTSGNWLVPTINGTPHFTKPPLTYWLIASGIKLLGTNEWGARIFHGLCFFLTTLIVGLLSATIWNNRTGILATLLYATMYIPYTAGNTTTTDTVLAFFETAAVACFWMSLKQKNNYTNRTGWVLFMFVFFGFAFLTKGPPGLLPLVPIIVYLLLIKEKSLFSGLPVFCGVAVFCMIALPWYILVINHYEGLLSYFFKHECYGRIFLKEYGRNTGLLGALKIYPHTIILGALPWSLYWPVILKKTRPRVLTLSWWSALRKRPVALFLLLWFSVPLLLFCLASTKLPFYILPLFVPLAMVTAGGITKCCPERINGLFPPRKRLETAVCILIAILFCSRVVSSYIPVKRDSRTMWRGIRGTIHNHTGTNPYEIALVDVNYNGLAFYSHQKVTFFKIRKQTRPSFFPVRRLGDEYKALPYKSCTTVFLVRKKKLKKVLPELQKRCGCTTVEKAPFKHVLIFCKSSPPI